MNQTTTLLLSENRITADQYQKACLQSRTLGGPPCSHLVREGVLSSEELVNFLEERYNITRKRRAELQLIPDDVIDRLDPQICRKHRILPIAVSPSGSLSLAMTDPGASDIVDSLASTWKGEITPVLLSESDMDWALNRYYQNRDEADAKRQIRPFDLLAADSTQWGSKDTSRQNLAGHSGITWGTTISEALTAAIDQISLTQEMPTAPPVPFNDTETIGAGLDSWNDTRPAAAVQDSATPFMRTFEHMPLRSPSSRPPIRRSSNLDITPSNVDSGLQTEGEILHGILTAQSAEQIIRLTLSYLLRFSTRAMFLITVRDRIIGYLAAGDESSQAAIRSFWIPFNHRSTLGLVANSGQLYLGPIGKKPADAVFCAALGGRPTCALVMPLTIAGKTIGLLFAENVDTPKIKWPRLARLIQDANTNLARLIQQQKLPRTT